MSLKYSLHTFMTKGFVSEIFYAYTGLKRSYNTQLSNGINESRLLAYSFFISLVLFLHRLPDKLTHNQKFNTKISLNDQIGIDLFASLFFVPIFLYIIAFFIHLLWLPFGSKATYFETRLAFFWATIISSPVLLSLSLIEGIYYSSWLSCVATAGSAPCGMTSKFDDARPRRLSARCCACTCACASACA